MHSLHTAQLSFGRLDREDDQKAPQLGLINDKGFKNTSGIGLGVLQDLQKLVGCLKVSDEQKGKEFLPMEKQDLKTRGQENFKYSARINLVFRSNNILKTWARSKQRFSNLRLRLKL